MPADPSAQSDASSPSRPPSIVGSIRDAAAPDLSLRFSAALLDGVVASLLSLLFSWIPFLGGTVGVLYVLGRDGLDIGPIRHRSVGKYVIGLRPRRLDGQPMDMAVSVRRNALLGLSIVPPIVGVVPWIGWALGFVAGTIAFLAFLYEVVRLIRSPDGRRWGDHFAGTKVVESGDALV